MKHPQFENEHFYHIYNRGVEKRDIFIDKNDYLRFLEGLKEFNNPEMVTLRDPPPYRGLTSVRKKLVRIHAFCLMPNHFHLLLEQIADNGIPLFMQKLGTGYTMYFNLVNQRVGGLFQGTFKAKIIENETYLMHLLRYIHLNPIELVEAKWKEKGIAWKKVKKILDNYQWSSHHDYLGKTEVKPLYRGLTSDSENIVSTDFLGGLLDGPSGYEDFLKSWVAADLHEIIDLIME